MYSSTIERYNSLLFPCGSCIFIHFLKNFLSLNFIYYMQDDQKEINEDNLKVLHLIETNPKISQRGMAEAMNFSLGKVNYCIKALSEIGFIKLKNFSKSKNKTGYLYVLTPKGVQEKAILTKEFLQRKQLEYEKLYNYFHDEQ